MIPESSGTRFEQKSLLGYVLDTHQSDSGNKTHKCTLTLRSIFSFLKQLRCKFCFSDPSQVFKGSVYSKDMNNTVVHHFRV